MCGVCVVRGVSRVNGVYGMCGVSGLSRAYGVCGVSGLYGVVYDNSGGVVMWVV